jgi:hypothetical protein
MKGIQAFAVVETGRPQPRDRGVGQRIAVRIEPWRFPSG